MSVKPVPPSRSAVPSATDNSGHSCGKFFKVASIGKRGSWYEGSVDEGAVEAGEGTGSGRRFRAAAGIGTTRFGSDPDDDHEGSERPEPGLRLGRLRE